MGANGDRYIHQGQPPLPGEGDRGKRGSGPGRCLLTGIGCHDQQVDTGATGGGGQQSGGLAGVPAQSHYPAVDVQLCGVGVPITGTEHESLDDADFAIQHLDQSRQLGRGIARTGPPVPQRASRADRFQVQPARRNRCGGGDFVPAHAGGHLKGDGLKDRLAALRDRYRLIKVPVVPTARQAVKVAMAITYTNKMVSKSSRTAA